MSSFKPQYISQKKLQKIPKSETRVARNIPIKGKTYFLIRAKRNGYRIYGFDNFSQSIVDTIPIYKLYFFIKSNVRNILYLGIINCNKLQIDSD